MKKEIINYIIKNLENHKGELVNLYNTISRYYTIYCVETYKADKTKEELLSKYLDVEESELEKIKIVKRNMDKKIILDDEAIKEIKEGLEEMLKNL